MSRGFPLPKLPCVPPARSLPPDPAPTTPSPVPTALPLTESQVLRVPGSRGPSVPVSQNLGIPGSHGPRVPGSQNFRIPGPQGPRVSESPVGVMPRAAICPGVRTQRPPCRFVHLGAPVSRVLCGSPLSACPVVAAAVAELLCSPTRRCSVAWVCSSSGSLAGARCRDEELPEGSPERLSGLGLSPAVSGSS